ncbi:hypothetical protein Tco_1300001 [Tanacetum coccineum]
MTTKAQQSALDNALVAPENQRVISKCNMRINPGMKPNEPTYQVVLDALALTTCYPAFLITAEVPVIYMHKFWATINKHNASYRFKIDNKKEIKYITDVIVDHLHPPWRNFASIINKCLCGKIDNKDSKKQAKMLYPRFTKIIIHHFLEKDKSISMRNRTFMHTARDDSLLGTMRFVSRHEDTQVYGAILPKSMTNQAMLDSVAYKTYYAIASGAEPSKSKKPKRKSNLAISSEETPSKNKPTKAKKDVPSTKKPTTNPKPTKNKAPVKADRGKRLNVLFEVALSEAAQLKEIIKRSKKDFYISHASGSDEGTGAKPGVPDVPKYDSKSNKESWGDSGEEDDDDEDDTKDDEGNDDGDGSDDDDNNGDDDDDNDGDDDDDDNDGNDDDDSDHKRTESDRYENPNLN